MSPEAEEQGRILVVDDDEGVRAYLSHALEAASYRVRTAETGRDALAALRAAPDWAHMVIVDLAMPDGDGFELLGAMRQSSSVARLPALIVSGFDDRRVRVAGLDAGANDFLTKPIDRDELLARVRAHLRVAQAAQQLHQETCVDPLTGLMNRHGFSLHVQRAIERATGDGTSLAVAFFDFDGFKAINDRFGHRVGDEVLWMFARLLSRNLRSGDMAARWGGDEFVVGLLGADQSLSSRVVARIQREASRVRVPRLGVRFEVSAGVASLLDDPSGEIERRADRLVDAADRAMYDDKARRIGRVDVSSALEGR